MKLRVRLPSPLSTLLSVGRNSTQGCDDHRYHFLLTSLSLRIKSTSAFYSTAKRYTLSDQLPRSLFSGGYHSIKKINTSSDNTATMKNSFASFQKNYFSSAGAEASDTVDTTTKTKKRDRVVILGTGWAGFNMAMYMNTNKRNSNVDLTIISPRNHFVFTPLLPSAAVGTLEPRTIQEPIRSVIGNDEHSRYLQAKARSLDVTNRTINCESIHNEVFDVPYDKLIIAVGVKTNTFGIKSIKEGAQGYYNVGNKTEGHCVFYLKQLAHARAIRANIIDCFEKASIPTVPDDEKKLLLSFVIVGGGPTSCEFTAELHGKCVYQVIFCRLSFKSREWLWQHFFCSNVRLIQNKIS
jgi:Pyridine nucleotide-disulphide oxidoreductase